MHSCMFPINNILTKKIFGFLFSYMVTSTMILDAKIHDIFDIVFRILRKRFFFLFNALFFL